MFFLGLFVLVYGVEKAGLIHIMAQGLVASPGQLPARDGR